MSVDQLSSVFGALADPTRRAILLRLVDGDLAVRELAAPFPMSQPAISRHLKVLEHAGLISRARRATARLSHLEPEPLRDATQWLARYQAFWDRRFDQLDELLTELQRQPQPSSGTPRTPQTPGTIDRRPASGRKEGSRANDPHHRPARRAVHRHRA